MGTFASIFWTLLLLVPWASAGPVQLSTCASECRTPLSPKFRHAVGQTYVYQYNGQTKTSIAGTSTDEALLQINAQVWMTFRSPCDVVVQLKQTTVTGLNDKVDSSELEKRPLLVSWQDGLVESVCPHHEDPAWAVNIKRGVLSMLQHTSQFLDVSEKNVVESDVIGRCPTSYEVETGSVSEGKPITVIKTKEPNQCSQRVGRHSAIPSVTYDVAADIQSVPLMKSSSVCRQQIKEGITESVECKEAHLYRPLSRENGGGAQTHVMSTMKFISIKTSSAIKMSGDFEKSNLIFDATGHFDARGTKDVSSVIKSLCSQLASESQAPVSQIFTELVHSLRRSNPKEVKAAYANMQGKKNCPEMPKTEKMFLDALPQAGSPGAVALMADLIKDQKVSKRQALSWFMSLPLSKFVTSDSIRAVLPLVDSMSDSPLALLSIAGMARRYCTEHPRLCESSNEIQQLSNKLGKLIGNKCQNDELRVLSSLKAIGNLGIFNQDILQTVITCIKDEKLPASIRVAAIETTRNSPSNKPIKEVLFNILADKEEDNEIRITAYLAIMRCPCSKTLLRIQNILADEEYNQVGSFITSHLNNLKQHKSPSKQEASRLISKLQLDRSFKFDLRKYSRNFASNHFCSLNNAGWDIDANLIYSTKSFLPRSANFNLTLDLFGHSVNLFEMGARMENVERLLENYLGPDGSIQKEGIKSLLSKVGEAAKNVKDSVSSAARSKRATIKSGDLNAIDKMVDLKELKDSIKFDAFVRVFGSEIALLHYRGKEAPQSADLLEDVQSRLSKAIKAMIEGAKKVDVDIARSLMFLDTAATFPTIAGVPIKLAINGTTTVGLGLESKIDIAALMRDPRNADLKFKINPLAVTELSAAMTVDMVIAKTGVKLVANIHSTAAADLTAKLVKGSSIDLKLNLPKTKVVAIETKSELLLIQQKNNEVERTKKLTIDNEVTFNRGGCFERLSPITGLRVCATTSMTITPPPADCSKDRAPMFLLSGMFSDSFVIEKIDPKMQGYSLTAQIKEESSKIRSLVVVFDTPGSSTARKVTFRGSLITEPDVVAKIEAKTPWGNIAMESELINRAELKSLMMKVTRDQKRYLTKVALKVQRSDESIAYDSTVEMETPNQPLAVIMEGRLAYALGKSLEIKMKPTGPLSRLPMSFEASLKNEVSGNDRRLVIERFDLITPLGQMELSSEVSMTPTARGLTASIKYGTQKQHQISFNGQMARQSGPNHAYKTVAIYKSSRFPVMNMDLRWDLEMAPATLINTIVLKHGPESEQNVNILTIRQQSTNRGRMLKDLFSENKFEITYPRYSVDLKMEQQLQFDNQNIKGLVLVISNKNRMVDGSLNVVFVPTDPKTLYQIDAKLALPGRSIELRDVGKKTDAQTFTMSPVLTMVPGGKYELTGKTVVRRDNKGTSVSVDSELRMEGNSNPIKIRHTFQMTEDMTITTSNKLEWSGQPQVSIDGKIFLRTPIPVVEMSAVWNGRFEGKLESRLASKDSKLDLNMNFLRFDRRVTFNGLYKVQGESRQASFNTAWDADKDPNKQFGMELSVDRPTAARAIDVKAAISALGRRYALNANAKMSDDPMNGENMARLEMEMPSSEKIVMSATAINVYTSNKIVNRWNLDMSLPSAQEYHIGLDNVINDLNRELAAFNAVTELELRSPRAGKIVARWETKRAVRNEERNTDFKITINAPKYGPIIDGSFNIELKKGNLKLNSKYQRGPMLVTVESQGKKNIVGSKTSIDGFFEIKAPKTSWQQFKIGASSSFEYTSRANFEHSDKLTIQYQNSKNIILDSKVKMSSGSLDLNLNLETPYQALRRQGLSVSGRIDTVIPKYEGSVTMTWNCPQKRDVQKISMDVEIERRIGQSLIVKISAASPVERYETAEIRFDARRLNEGQTLEADLSIDVSSRKFELKSKLNMDRKQPEIDVTVTRSSENPLRFYGRIQTQTATKTIETRIDWGQGTINVNGKGKFVDFSNFEVALAVDSPSLEGKNVEIIAVNKMDKKRRTVELIIKKQSANVFAFKSTFEWINSSSLTQLKGTTEVQFQEPSISTTMKFDLHKKELDGSDKGRELRIEVESFGYVILKKLSGHLKYTQKEKSGVLSACSVSDNCFSPSFLLKDSSSGSKSSHEVNFLLGFTEDSVDELMGLRHKYQSTGSKLEQTTDVILSQKSNRVLGYKFTRDGTQYVVELSTPARKLGSSFEHVKGARNTMKNTISFWSTCETENRLVIVNTVEPHKLDDMEGLATVTTIKHPLLTRDLEYKMDYHVAKNERANNRFHLKIDVDVMDSKHERVFFETYVRGKVEDKSRNIAIDTVIRSKGTGVSATTTLNGAISEQSISLSGNLKFSDKGRVEKELMASINASANFASVTVGSPAKQLSFEGRWNVGHIVGHRHLQFSGYTQVFNLQPLAYVVDLSTAPHVDIRVFRKNDPEKHYHIRADLVDDSRFEMALEHQVGVHKKDLAAAYLTLNRSDLLHSRITWNAAELRSLVETARSRSVEVSREVRTTLEPLSSQLSPIIAKWKIEGDKLRSLSTGIKQRLQCIRKGIASDESVKAAVELVDSVESWFEDLLVIVDGLNIKLLSVEELIAKMTEIMREVNEKYAEYRRKVFESLSVSLEDIHRLIEQLKNALMNPEGALRKVGEYYERVSTRYGRAIEQLKAIINSRYQRLTALLDSTDFLDKRFVDLLKMLLSPEGRLALRKKFVQYLEEDLLVTLKESLHRISEEFPETKRITCQLESYMDKWRKRMDEFKLQKESAESTPSYDRSQWLKKITGEVTVYDLKKGEIQYQLPLVRPIGSLRQLPSIMNIGSISIKKWTEADSEYNTLSDAYMKMRSRYNPLTMKSRVRGFASLVGSTGYITFDKKAFDLSVNGNCQYLLARDFLNKDFTVAANYDEAAGKTIIFADQNDQVEIKNKEILVNNRVASLPVTLKSITIAKEGDIVVVKRSHGVVLRCDLTRDACGLDISPFYTGRVMGLLGSFTNEEADDMKLPSGKIAKDASQFVSSWKLNKACRDKELKIQMLPESLTAKEKSSKGADSCQEILRDNSSPLRPCFGVVSPTPYYELCVKSVDQTKNPKSPAISAASAYIAACQRFGISSLTAPAL